MKRAFLTAILKIAPCSISKLCQKGLLIDIYYELFSCPETTTCMYIYKACIQDIFCLCLEKEQVALKKNFTRLLSLSVRSQLQAA